MPFLEIIFPPLCGLIAVCGQTTNSPGPSQGSGSDDDDGGSESQDTPSSGAANNLNSSGGQGDVGAATGSSCDDSASLGDAKVLAAFQSAAETQNWSVSEWSAFRDGPFHPMHRLAPMYLCLVIAGCNPNLAAQPSGADQQHAAAGAKTETPEVPQWSFPSPPGATPVVPSDWQPKEPLALPKKPSPKSCGGSPAPHAQCPANMEAALVDIFTQYPVWELAPPTRSECTLSFMKTSPRMAEGEKSSPEGLKDDQLRLKDEEKLRTAARLSRNRQRLGAQGLIARDHLLRALASCPGLPEGYLENLRAELRPECTALLTKTLRKKRTSGAWRAEIEARLVVQLAKESAPTPIKLPSWISAKNAIRRLEENFLPALAVSGERLLVLSAYLEELPPTPGRDISEAALWNSWCWRASTSA